MNRVYLRIRGRVQGVYFRQSTRERAIELGLTGWVRNRRDGSVELVAEGDGNSLQALVNWCKIGPSMAEVTEVERLDEGPVGMFGKFDVHKTH
jgi:acylphosphatase